MRTTIIGAIGVIGLCGAVAFGQGAAGRQGGGGGRQGGWGEGGGTTIIEHAQTDHTVPIPKEKLDQYLKDMDAKKLATLRMIEGGKFNVNIRRITNAETALVHPVTIDVWVVIEGSGTLTDRRQDRKRQDRRRHVASTQGRRCGVHPGGPAARRQRRQRQHHVAEHPLGRRLSSKVAFSHQLRAI